MEKNGEGSKKKRSGLHGSHRNHKEQAEVEELQSRKTL